MSDLPRCWALVPAAGVGRRMGSKIPKQYLQLAGRPVLEHTLERLLGHPLIEGVVVALSADDAWWPSLGFAADSRVLRVDGGAERCHSVLNGLAALQRIAPPESWVLVHDAARPCLRAGDIDRLVGELHRHPVGGILAAPLHDTVKQADDAGDIARTLPRERLWRAFTPQMFRLDGLKSALESALEKGLLVTDEASAMELAGHAPRLVEGHADNIKITRPEDLALAEFHLRQQQATISITVE